MVGKVVRRARLHLAAPKLVGSFGQAPAEEGVGAWPALPAKVQTFLPSNIFAGVKIDPKTLVKKLDADSRSVVSVIKGEEKKVLLSKKDKMKLRKERWLKKIEDIKLAKKLQKAEAKRKATPVVGDMNPLMEALPELSDLVTINKFSKRPKTLLKRVSDPAHWPVGAEDPIMIDDQQHFEAILDAHWHKEHLEYLVQWKDFGPRHREWVCSDDVRAPCLQKKFRRSYPDKAFPDGWG